MIRWIMRVATTGALLASSLVLAGASAAGAAAPAGPGVARYGADNFGDFNMILPPGENGFDNLGQLALFKLTGRRPPHNSDQLGMYSNLTTAAGSITDAQLRQYYTDATFGVPAGDVAGTQSPEPGVTIVRDSGFGIPHIYGDTRAELMYGIGYATAEDRLFFVDALRHAGQGDLASFAGGSNAGMDEQVWAGEPYTQQDLVNQVNYLAAEPGGAQLLSDATNYINGINAYITQAQQPGNLLSMMPGEYAVLGKTPEPFTLENLVSIGALVGGIFGGGGGEQLSNAVLYESMLQKFGPEPYAIPGSPEAGSTAPPPPQATSDTSGFATFLGFDAPDDPEAPTTVHGTAFPYQTLPAPSAAVRATIALPDAGSVQYVDPVIGGALPAAGGAAVQSQAANPLGLPSPGASSSGLLAFPRSMSNALLVSARDSATGHPLAVMGPQVAYFSPQILMEEDIHGPGIAAEGAAFPGVNLYVELGHGPDYAWSATSSGQNITDTFAVPLCNPSGGGVTTSSDDYVLNGQCVPMENLVDSESWKPNLADPTKAGSVTLQTQRTAYGLVVARATVSGQPVAYTNLRSTYMHELDSALGFERFNEPSQMQTPQAFSASADRVDYTFNWFYANTRHIAYFNSGLNPVRAPDTDPLFPTWSSDAWPGLAPSATMTPESLTEEDTPQSAHPQVVDQDLLTSWNNKQAPGYGDPATAQEFSSIYRSQLLDTNLNAELNANGGKLTLSDVVNAMGLAGTQDLRGVEVLPYALQIIGTPSDPSLAAAVDELQAWVASGAHRINREDPGASGDYDQTDAVRIMDAWWPLLVKAEFGSTLGSPLLSEVQSEFAINDEPGHGTSGSHLGSAFDVGFYGIVQKDLRAVLGDPVADPLNHVYCGGGSLDACRSALESSLAAAVAETPAQVYPADGVCKAGDQMCSDSIEFRALGGITQPLIEWVNRPTFQQADDLDGQQP